MAAVVVNSQRAKHPIWQVFDDFVVALGLGPALQWPPPPTNAAPVPSTWNDLDPYPAFRIPLSLTVATDPWLRDNDEASKAVGLLYDIIIGSILQVLGQSLSLQSCGSLLPYISFFRIVHWVWLTQLHYDIRYEGEDMYHRMYKAIQLMALAYIGTAGAGWNPWPSRGSGDRLDHIRTKGEMAAHLADQSFLLVSVGALIHTTLLGVQYAAALYLAWYGPRRRETVLLGCMVVSIPMLAVAVGLADNGTSDRVQVAKLVLLYGAIAIQVATHLGIQLVYKRTLPERQRIIERYTALTFVILGEGLIGAISACAQGFAVLEQRGILAYVQVGLALGITFLLWTFLFQAFDDKRLEKLSKWRTAVWEGLHVPLHVALILLFAAISNIIIVICVFQAQKEVNNAYDAVLELIANGTSLDAINPKTPTATLWDIYSQGRDYQQTLETAHNQLERNSVINKDLAAGRYSELDAYYKDYLANNSVGFDWMDPELTLEKSRLTTYMALLNRFGFGEEDTEETSSAVQEQMVTRFLALATSYPYDILNYTSTGKRPTNVRELDQTAHDAHWREAMVIGRKVYTSLIMQLVDGIWWLFPTAGGALFICGWRSIVQNPVLPRRHISAFVGKMVCGVVLICLVALNDSVARAGASFVWRHPDAQLSRMILLARSGWALAIVFAIYALVMLIPHFVYIGRFVISVQVLLAKEMWRMWKARQGSP